jgi:multiple sugar transport system substrate-binding protein
MRNKLILVVMLVLLIGVVSFAAAQGPVTITWFVGLGTGTDAQQIDAENQLVADFNASQSDINLEINIAPDFTTATDTLGAMLAAGTAPDIIGPVGVGGSNRYEWLDLKDLIDSTNYDLSGFDPALLSLYETTNGGYSAIPFAVYPSAIYYNRGLFDEAGLNYPPAAFDEKYTMPDGTEVDWNYDTIAQIAQLLTVDASGNDATMDGFDPENIVQFGFSFQWERIRLMWTDFQPETTYYNWDTGQVSIPDSWKTATHWIQDGLWKYHFIPNTTYSNSDLLNATNEFDSGNVAMLISPSWYTCCLGDSVGNFEWDFGVVPQSLDGQYHVALDADTFRIPAASMHPNEAFTVLTYLLDQAVPTLAPAYGAFPARAAYQQPWIDSKDEQYNWGINWQVLVDSLAYADSAAEHHESNLPNWSQVYDREFALQTLLWGDSGATADVDAELETFRSDVQSITEQTGS